MDKNERLTLKGDDVTLTISCVPGTSDPWAITRRLGAPLRV